MKSGQERVCVEGCAAGIDRKGAVQMGPWWEITRGCCPAASIPCRPSSTRACGFRGIQSGPGIGSTVVVPPKVYNITPHNARIRTILCHANAHQKFSSVERLKTTSLEFQSSSDGSSARTNIEGPGEGEHQNEKRKTSCTDLP